MLAVFLLIAFSLGVAYFATQNTGLVHILLGSYLLRDIPLYVIVIGSILLGVFISWLISLVDTFSSAFTIHGKESEIKKMQKVIDELRQESHEQEIEITHLKDELEKTTPSEQEQSADEKPSFHQGFRQALGI